MLLVEIVQKFVSADVVPSRYTIQSVLGFSAQTLVRRGYTMMDVQSLYKEMTRGVKSCPCCGIEVKNSANTYCSNSCAAKINNTKRRQSLHHPKNSEQFNPDMRCLCCDVTLVKSQRHYCSASCQQRHKQDTFISEWLSGKEIATKKGCSVPSRIRRYLLDKHEHRCAKCGWGEINPVTGKTPLEVEHIDGDSSNNSPENLILLCPNCHSLTPTYKALNKGKGRYNRMMRYREGKSY